MKKRMISLLLVICLVGALLPASVLAASPLGTIDNPWTSNSVKVYRDGTALHVFSSGSMENYSGSSSAPWYSVSGSIDTIVIESGVDYLGDNAFAACGSVKTVRLKRDMTSAALGMGVNALPINADVELELFGSAYMPDYDSNQPWANLKNHIVKVTMNEGIRSIGAQAFSGCQKLTSVVIPSTAEYIGQQAFESCIALTDVTLRHDFGYNKAGKAFTIGTNAFPVGNSGFTINMEVYGTEAIPDYVSADAQPWAAVRNYIKTLKVDGNVAGIGDNAFSACSNLKNVTVYFAENAGHAEKKFGVDWFREHNDNAVINFAGYSADKSFLEWGNGTFSNKNAENAIYFYNRDGVTVTATWVETVRALQVKPAENKDFGEVDPGYEAQAPYEVIIKNIGNKASGQLHAELSRGNNSAFALNKKYIDSVPVKGTVTIAVAPVLGLPVGDYNDDVIISDENGTIARFTVFFSVSTTESRARDFVKGLYINALGRGEYEIDDDGLDNWVNAIVSGKLTAAQVAASFYSSKEFRDRGVTDGEFVKSVFKSLLWREADADGLKTWLDYINSGKSRSAAFKGIADSKEFQDLCIRHKLVAGTINPADYEMSNTLVFTGPVADFVERLYNNVLGRASEKEGLEHWTTLLLTKKESGAEVAIGFYISDEYTAKKQTNRTFVENLYQTLMDRTYDEPGLNHWLEFLDEGKTRAWVFAQFIISDEFHDICAAYGINPGTIDPAAYNIVAVASPAAAKVSPAAAEAYVKRLYVELLGRAEADIDAAGLKNWTDSLTEGKMTAAEVAANMLITDEFIGRKLQNEAYIKALYRALMMTEGDDEGIMNWKNAMLSGSTRADILKQFVDSPAFKTVCNNEGLIPGTIDPAKYDMGKASVSYAVEPAQANAYVTGLYQGLLGHLPDPAGLTSWSNLLMSGKMNAAQVAAGIASSTEFAGKKYSKANYIQALYVALLGHDAPESGLDHWLNQFKDGMTRAQMLECFCSSEEFQNRCTALHLTKGTIKAADYTIG